MNFLIHLVLLTLLCCACCLNEDVIKVEEQYEKTGENREGKQLRKQIEHEGWRVVDSRNWQNSDEWIPKDSPPFTSDNPQKPIPRRRRIRKRKRRPPLIVSSEESEEYPQRQRRRRIRPQTLENVSDSWAEIEGESLRRPYSRRRITPVYVPEIPTEENVEVEPLSAVLHFEEHFGDKTEAPPKPSRVYEKVRDPFTALEEAEAKARLKKKQQQIEQNKEEETTTISHLKALLKQSGGSLSLSELLQQKNLSLDDLLKGKQHAISALTEKPETITEIVTEYKNFEELDITETPKVLETRTFIDDFKTTERPKLQMEEKVTLFDKNTNRNYETLEDSSESNSAKEHLDAQRNRLALLHNNEGIKTFTSKSYVVVTEPTTERRIFVPSHSKHYTSFNYKPNMLNKTAETIIKQTTKSFSTEKIQTTHATPSLSTHKHILGNKYLDYRSKYVSAKPKLKSALPITSAKLNQSAKKHPILPETETTSTSTIVPPSASTIVPPPTSTTVTTSIPLNAFKINIKDLFGMLDITKETETIKPKEEGPVKMTIDIETLMKKATTEKNITDYNPKIDLKALDNSQNEVTTEIKNETEASEKIKPTTARDEIMEILRDHVSRQNLSRILELRNMTVEELVAQRERGSSQLHLADIFHNQTREPEPPNEPYVGHIRSLSPSLFDRKPKTIPNPMEIKKDSQGSNYFTSVVDLKPLQLNYQDKEVDLQEPPKKPVPAEPIYTVTSFPTYKIEMEKIMKHNQPPPFQLSIWKNLYPDLYTGSSENSNLEDELDKLKSTKVDDILQNDIRRVEEVENTISEAVNGQLNIDLNENNYEEVDDYIQLPRGVKSTIIASAAIIGISVFVFLTVFIIFKWLQKQKKRLCYSNSFSGSRIKSPILETRPRRTIRTIMSETLGRKKKYSNVYPQSMSDYIWESDKKPFQ